MRTAGRLGALVAGCAFALGCAAAADERAEIPSLDDTEGRAGSGTAETRAAEGEPVSPDVAVARYQRCLEEQGIIRDPDGIGVWITSELSGEAEDGPLMRRHHELSDRAYAACAELQAAMEQDFEPIEPDDPDLVRRQAAYAECIERFGYEFETTADGWQVQQPAAVGTPEFELYERRLMECDDEVG